MTAPIPPEDALHSLRASAELGREVSPRVAQGVVTFVEQQQQRIAELEALVADSAQWAEGHAVGYAEGLAQRMPPAPAALPPNPGPTRAERQVRRIKLAAENDSRPTHNPEVDQRGEFTGPRALSVRRIRSILSDRTPEATAGDKPPSPATGR